MPILITLAGIALLLILIMAFRLNAFLALIIVALGVGLAQGMPFEAVADSIKNGVGGTLGYLALILGFGAMLGGIIAGSGAAQQIAQRLVGSFGEKYITWALILTGFIVGIPLFYTVGFIMLIPIIFSIAISTRLPLLYIGIPMVAALSVTHGFLPPHPAPTAIAVIYGADIGLTLLWGIIIAIPTIIIAGPIFAPILKRIKTKVPEHLFDLSPKPEEELPGFGISLLTALSPVILMAIAAALKLMLPEDDPLRLVTDFLGNPIIAMLLSVLLAIYTLGIRQGKSMKSINSNLVDGVKPMAIILLIIGGGGALKQVLIDSGISAYIVQLFSDSSLSPLVLAWMIAAALRIALGSATVAALTAAGIATPLIQNTGVSPELLVLATGAGSLTCSQVNDTGFWLFKEYFNLSIVDTFRSWTAMETIVSICGLIGVLVLDMFV